METSAQATRLRSIGCDTGQGWLYSRPVSPDRISELLGTESGTRSGTESGTVSGTESGTESYAVGNP